MDGIIIFSDKKREPENKFSGSLSKICRFMLNLPKQEQQYLPVPDLPKYDHNIRKQ